MQRIFNHVLILILIFVIMLVCQITVEPLKMEGLYIHTTVKPLELKLKVDTSIKAGYLNLKSIVVVYRGNIAKTVSLFKYLRTRLDMVTH